MLRWRMLASENVEGFKRPCCTTSSPDFATTEAASQISATRQKAENRTPLPAPKTAFIVSSLKRPEEVARLRNIYPHGFVLLGVHADESRRLRHLTEDLGISQENAKALIERDANEERVDHGQRLTRTFHLADFFVRIAENHDKLKCDLRRIVHLMFGQPHMTPSFDEHAMFFAFASALRSADLSRQVGAVIARDEQILATGANDCPRAGGGLYWPIRDDNDCLIDVPKGRDFKRGFDSNRQEQNRIIDRIIALGQRNGLDADLLRKTLEDSPISDLTEYGRVVHAEMEAILACARSNVSTQEATLYSTTFPCHNCAKHIIVAGITRVVYVEPYEKSKAPEFHDDSVVFGFDQNAGKKVTFVPFVGIGPRRFFDLFSMRLSSGYDLIRKDETGAAAGWALNTARLRFRMLPHSYLDHELEACNLFNRALPQEGN
jgi:deoxycytidylate deaminase